MGIRYYPPGPRAYIDLDGVLADFEDSCRRHGHVPSVHKLHPGAYRQLDPIQGAIEAVQAIEGMGLHTWVLSKIPSRNAGSASEKLEWVRQHLPSLEDRVILTPDKGCVGTEQDLLIDDHPEWANASTFRGKVFHFKGDWAATLDQIQTYLTLPREVDGATSLAGAVRAGQPISQLLPLADNDHGTSDAPRG